jgi:hypothetical protein
MLCNALCSRGASPETMDASAVDFLSEAATNYRCYHERESTPPRNHTKPNFNAGAAYANHRNKNVQIRIISSLNS